LKVKSKELSGILVAILNPADEGRTVDDSVGANRLQKPKRLRSVTKIYAQ
jgi:hypothetical protein